MPDNGSDQVSEPVVSVDCSEVREGKLEELKTAIKELVGFVEANEPQPSPTTCTSVTTEPR